MECTQNLGQIIWKLVFYLLKLSLRKVIWKKYIDEFKMLILELLEEGKIEIIKKIKLYFQIIVVVKDSGYFFVSYIIWIFKTTFYPTNSIKVKKDETILIRVSRKIYNFLGA